MLCLCVLCKYVNGNVYKHSVLQEKNSSQSCEKNIHGRMRKPSACTYIRTHARYLENAHALLITCSGEVYGILLRERRNLSVAS